MAELRAIYLDMMTAVGELHGLVVDCGRHHPAAVGVNEAFEEFQGGIRKVGLDMRLTSPGGFQMGLQASVEAALRTLDRIDHDA